MSVLEFWNIPHLHFFPGNTEGGGLAMAAGGQGAAGDSLRTAGWEKARAEGRRILRTATTCRSRHPERQEVGLRSPG